MKRKHVMTQCVVPFKKNLQLHLFIFNLVLGKFDPRCSYRNVLIKKKHVFKIRTRSTTLFKKLSVHHQFLATSFFIFQTSNFKT